MRLIKLKFIKEFTDQHGTWVVCEEKGLRWIVKRSVFETFKFAGFGLVNPTMYKKLATLIGTQHYPEVPKLRRYDLIKQMLESSTNSSIKDIFPNI